jgi:hypothetical protein
MADDLVPPIELELIQRIACVDVKVLKTDSQPTTADDWYVRIDGRFGDDDEDDVEFAAMGFLYAVALLSFADARPRGVSEIHFVSTDEWSVADTIRYLRFERGELHFYADYVRGRCMKTDVSVRGDGTFTVETVNRGKAATRWIGRLQGKTILAPVADAPPASRG